jgi:DNA-binding NarL/FixJ family response regulator
VSTPSIVPARGNRTGSLRRRRAGPPTAPGALDELTTQQREIAILAGRGLTNGEIAM